MVNSIKIRQIHTNTLTCEPILRRVGNGELLCICQCDGPEEPHIENRVYAFHSRDNGESWSRGASVYPEDGRAVYCTEVSVEGDEITAYLTVHSGRFLDWQCVMMKSTDNGYTWQHGGAPPHFPSYTFMRGRIRRSNGDIVMPYQHYPVRDEDVRRLLANNTLSDKVIWYVGAPYCETGVLVSADNGQSYARYPAARMDMAPRFVWAEPTVIELSDGTLAMLMRKDGSGCLWYAESQDGGRSWSDVVKTDIPNPGNKPKLIPCGDKIVLIHTPNSTVGWDGRHPLSLWISDDDMHSFKCKRILTDFPGAYCYADGFYENGHVMFTIEHNRHSVLFFDVTLEE